MNRYLSTLFLGLCTLTTIIYSDSLQKVDKKEFGNGEVRAISTTIEEGSYFIAYGGNDQSSKREICIGKFNQTTEVLDRKKTERFSSQNSCSVNSLSWLNTSSLDKTLYLAAGGYTEHKGNEICIYEYKTNTNRIKKKCDKDFSNGEVFAVDWFTHNDKHFLVVGGDDKMTGQNLRVYEFENNKTLTLCDTANFYHGSVYAIDCLVTDDRCLIAVGGYEVASIRNELRIYEFNTTTKTLTLITTASFDGGAANSAKWFQHNEVTYLGVGGKDALSLQEIRVFTFASDTLTLDASACFYNGRVYSVSWETKDATIYLVAGGDDASETKELRVYSFDPLAHTLTREATASFNDGVVYAVDCELINSTLYVLAGGNDNNENEELRIYKLVVD